MVARNFLCNVTAAVPCIIHTMLTDNGIQFDKRRGTESCWSIPFDHICQAHNIEHRLSKVFHPRTNGQVERMNRTIREGAIKRYCYPSRDQLKSHLQTFLMAYDFARRLKTLNA